MVALGSFVEAADDIAQLRPILPQLLDEFFKLMNEVESEDLVFTLETIVEKLGEEIAPYALGLTANLAAAFWKLNAEDSKFLKSIRRLVPVVRIESIALVPETRRPKLEKTWFQFVMHGACGPGSGPSGSSSCPVCRQQISSFDQVKWLDRE